jgi:putative endopeptidase
MKYLKGSQKAILIAGLFLAFSLTLARTAGPTVEHGFDFADLDRTANACVDFNQFANGGWKAKNPIPAAYPSWGSFNVLQEHNRDVLHEILDETAKETDAQPGSNEQKVGDFYATCMDTSAIDAQGIKPLEPEFERIAAIKDRSGLLAEFVHLQSEGVSAPFRVDSTQDFKDSTKVTGEIDQRGLGLPDRDYYTKEDEKSKETRAKYVAHVQKMFELMGDSAETAAAESKTVMDMETALAKASQTRVERRDPEKVYHPMSVDQIKTLAPHLNWDDYFQTTGLAGKGEINVTAPDFFKELDQQFASTSLDNWKVYLRWHLINATAQDLSTPFVDEDFDFKGKTLLGTKENLVRWKRCVRYTDGALGEALGQVYVKKAFTPEAKAHALEMVHNLEAALKDDITTLPWMSPATRQQAIGKLEAYAEKIGYPDKWRDYSKLTIERGPYVENVLRAHTFEFNRDLAKVGKPLDRTEWFMSPPTVNAYYNPQMNEIVFPAGILQPPFYDPLADDAYNYGGIGAVIGHEMTHGFDDEGNKFDKDGNLKNWWTADDKKNFDARAACVVNQFDGFEVEKGLHENGKLVSGESIADLGGLTVALAAYKKSLEGKPKPPVIDGFTAEQRFFLGYAHVWAGNMRPEFARLLTNVDPHPLPQFRVNGPLSNMPAFAKAYRCKPGDPMVRAPKDRCQIW